MTHDEFTAMYGVEVPYEFYQNIVYPEYLDMCTTKGDFLQWLSGSNRMQQWMARYIKIQTELYVHEVNRLKNELDDLRVKLAGKDQTITHLSRTVSELVDAEDHLNDRVEQCSQTVARKNREIVILKAHLFDLSTVKRGRRKT